MDKLQAYEEEHHEKVVLNYEALLEKHPQFRYLSFF